MATLTTTITEALTLNGKDRGSTNTLTITGINDVYHRIVSCPDDVPLTLVAFKSTVGVAAAEPLMDMELVKYIRVTNLDGANPAVLNLTVDAGENDTAADKSASIQLEAGRSFIMGTPNEGISPDSDNPTLNVATSALEDLRSIHIDPISEALQVEVFIASA